VLSESHFFVPDFGMSAWHLKCAKHTGTNSDVVRGRINVRPEDMLVQKIR
jgi:hypothetical protein